MSRKWISTATLHSRLCLEVAAAGSVKGDTGVERPSVEFRGRPGGRRDGSPRGLHACISGQRAISRWMDCRRGAIGSL